MAKQNVTMNRHPNAKGKENGPMEKRREWAALGIALVTAFVMMAICSRTSFLYPFMDGVDQNCFMTVGKGMMNGLVPYRDLFEQKGPLLYFLHGLAWLISKDTWIGVYILESLFLGVFLWYYWKIWNLYGERRWSMAWMPLLALLVTVTSSFASGDNVEEYCIALMAVSMYDYLKYLRDYPANGGHMERRTLLINGTLAGCVLWMKYIMLGFWFAWMATVFFCLILQKKWKEAFLDCVWFLAGMLGIATIPWVIYFGIHGAIGDWLYAYFYCNIFAYSSDSASILSRLTFTWEVVADGKPRGTDGVHRRGISVSLGVPGQTAPLVFQDQLCPGPSSDLSGHVWGRHIHVVLLPVCVRVRRIGDAAAGPWSGLADSKGQRGRKQ